MTNKQVQNNIYLKKVGFTLAEVLVTLAIIGVVAALTIPSLVTSVQEAQYKSTFKKIYSSLSNATNRIIEENPTFQSQLTGHDLIKNEYGKYINFVKTCDDWAPRVGACWPTDTNYLNGVPVGDTSYIHNSMAITADGASLIFTYPGPSGSCGSLPSSCLGAIDIDVNGLKKPNTYGRDIFSVYITPTRLVPSAPDGYYGCNLNGGGGRIALGEVCASLVLSNTDYRIK